MAIRPCIVVAPDKFKSSLTAAEAAEAMRLGCLDAFPDAHVTVLPMADGGEGTLEVLVAQGGRATQLAVTGPLGTVVQASLCVLGDTVFIETAQACGLHLVPAPGPVTALAASTYGVGQLVRAALDLDPGRIVLGLGGSATTDGGAGMAQALGARLTDDQGRSLGPGGAELVRLGGIDVSRLDARLSSTELVVAHDVDSPLLGPVGAACEFAPQKGANAPAVTVLEAALARFAAVVHEATGIDVASMPGAGAAGGLGAGAMALLGASSVSGAGLLLDLVGADSVLAGAELAMVGEGRLDRQSLRGKAPAAVASLAAARGVPVVAVAGVCDVDARELEAAGICSAHSLLDVARSTDDSLARAGTLLRQVATDAVRSWVSGPSR